MSTIVEMKGIDRSNRLRVELGRRMLYVEVSGKDLEKVTCKA